MSELSEEELKIINGEFDDDELDSEGVEENEHDNNFPGSPAIYTNTYAGKKLLTREEVLNQISIWTGALLIYECYRQYEQG